jgi:hypothetical protein
MMTARVLGSFLLMALGIAYAPLGSVYGQRERFNPDGAFWIMGDAPKGFEDFGGINLNSNRNRRLPAAGVDINGRTLKFKTLSISRDRLVFTTEAVRGISYGFKGKFLRGGTFAAQDLTDVAVLEGTLTKFSKGQSVAESKMKFTYFGGT